jgi:GMP synthase-like glutamine amidotransferase
MGTPHILILDNSPRRLGTYWFTKWFRQLGCRVSAYYFWGKSRAVSLDNFEAVVIGGSPVSATEDLPWILQELEIIEQADQQEKPVLGVCFGSQLLARAYYGKHAIRHSSQVEIGWHRVSQTGHRDPLFAEIPVKFTSFQFHTEEVVPLAGMQVLADSAVSEVQAFRVSGKPVWGTQFHLEVTPRSGRDLLRKSRQVCATYGLSYEELVAAARPSEAAPQLFSNFIGAAVSPDGRQAQD